MFKNINKIKLKKGKKISQRHTGGAPSAIWKSNRRTSMASATTVCILEKG